MGDGTSKKGRLSLKEGDLAEFTREKTEFS